MEIPGDFTLIHDDILNALLHIKFADTDTHYFSYKPADDVVSSVKGSTVQHLKRQQSINKEAASLEEVICDSSTPPHSNRRERHPARLILSSFTNSLSDSSESDFDS